MLHKTTKKAKSPTGKPSKKSSAVKKMEKGDFSGGPDVKKKKPKKKKKPAMRPGTIPRVEKGLEDAGA